jgi:hypothetical protein
MVRLVCFFCICAATLVSAQPVIDHLAVDEAQDKLLIYGSFSSLTGTVTVDDTTLEVLDWSDSLIYVALPNKGNGAGGDVVVADLGGTSLPRVLSIFKLTILSRYYIVLRNANGFRFFHREDRIWYVNWRADLVKRPSPNDTLIFFEISKSSLGYRGGGFFPWSDSSQDVDSSISLSGTVDLKNSKIYFNSALIHTPPPWNSGLDYRIAYKPRSLDFDSTGYLSGYIDSVEFTETSEPYKRDNRIYDQQILFPPSPKPAAVAFGKQDEDIALQIFSDRIEYSNPRSQQVWIARYDYMGREVQRIFSGRLSQGSHNFSVTPSSHSNYFLVVKTEDGRIIKKIIQ